MWKTGYPSEDGRYLVVMDYGFGKPYYDACNFALNLKKKDEYLPKKKGWYRYDSEWGCVEVDRVVAWTEIPVFKEQ